MKEIGKITNPMGLDSMLAKTHIGDMKEIGKMEYKMGKVNKYLMMALTTKDTLKMD